MKRILMAVLVVAGLATFVCASEYQKEGKGYNVTEFAPNGTLNQSLTINKVLVDGRNYMKFSVHPVAIATCSVKATATSGAATGVRHLVPVNTYYIRGINQATPFLNISGCTGGSFQME